MARFRLRPPKVRLVENDVEKQCLDILRYRGFNPVRLHSGRFLAPGRLCDECRASARWLTIGEPGIPDYVIPRFFLETKRPGADLSDAQKKKIWELEKMWDLRTVVVDNVDLLIAWLDQNVKR